jgi:hypothetical protein
MKMKLNYEYSDHFGGTFIPPFVTKLWNVEFRQSKAMIGHLFSPGTIIYGQEF